MPSKSIAEWCRSHGYKSRGTFYKLKSEGRAPDLIYPGPRITDDANARWEREREREAVIKADKGRAA